MVAGNASAESAPRLDAALTLGAATQQVGKGAGQTEDDPSVFASVRAARGAFYASAAANTVKLGPGGDGEVNLTVGAAPRVGDFDVSLAVHALSRLGDADGFDGRWVEYEAGVSRTFGRATAGVVLNYSPDADGAAREAWWNQAVAGWRISDATQISAAAGRRTAQGGGDYAAWNIGVSHTTPQRLVFDFRFYDTDEHAFGPEFDRRLVATLSHTF